MGVTAAARADWLAHRRDGIGASDVAGILGLSPWESPWSVYAAKVGLVGEDEPTEAMEFGRYAELAVVPWFMDRTFLTVAGEQTWCEHPTEPWMRCTIDGFVFDDLPDWNEWDKDNAQGALEIKSTSASMAEWADGVPDQYACQATWTMAVTGMERVWFAVLHLAFGRPQLGIYEFARDESDIAYVTERCRAFWFDHVVTGTPPPTDGHPATTAALGQAWPDADDTMFADDPLRRLCDMALDARFTVKNAEAAQARVDNELRAAMGDCAVLTDADRVLATWKPSTRHTIDTKALKAAEPELAAKYTTESTTRVLLLKTPKEQ